VAKKSDQESRLGWSRLPEILIPPMNLSAVLTWFSQRRSDLRQSQDFCWWCSRQYFLVFLGDRIPCVWVELTPGDKASAQPGGKLWRMQLDVTEEPEYGPGGGIVDKIVRPVMTCLGYDYLPKCPCLYRLYRGTAPIGRNAFEVQRLATQAQDG
jgi:hypothetical protein